MIDLEKLRAELAYDPVAGVFTWKVSKPAIFAGTVAGSVDKSTGFIKLGWNGKIWMAHRLAWIYQHGDIPSNMVVKQHNDKRDDIRGDNLYILGMADNRKAMKAKAKERA